MAERERKGRDDKRIVTLYLELLVNGLTKRWRKKRMVRLEVSTTRTARIPTQDTNRFGDDTTATRQYPNMLVG